MLMIAYILYNRGTRGETVAVRLQEQLVAAKVEAELMDADSPRGIQLAENYDILGRPAIVLVRADGSPMQVWQDGEDRMPLATDVAYMAHQ